MSATWEDKWWELSNGKRLLEEMRKEGMIKGDILKIKRKIITEMRIRKTEAYNTLTAMFKDLLSANRAIGA